MTHPDFRRKLEAIGFGFFIPVFFVSSGVRFDLDALTSSTSSVVMVPVFLAALVAVRGLPALALPPPSRRRGSAAIAGLHAGDVAAVHRRRDGDRPRSSG